MVNVAQQIGDDISLLRSAGSAGFAIGLHITFTSPRYLLQAYPPKWQDIYTRDGYLMLDPTVRWGLANDGWIDWSDLRGNDPDGILAHAEQHGMKHGITVALNMRGSRSIASLARSDRRFTAEEAGSIRSRVIDLHDLTLSVHSLPASLHDLLRRMSIILTQG